MLRSLHSAYNIVAQFPNNQSNCAFSILLPYYKKKKNKKKQILIKINSSHTNNRTRPKMPTHTRWNIDTILGRIQNNWDMSFFRPYIVEVHSTIKTSYICILHIVHIFVLAYFSYRCHFIPKRFCLASLQFEYIPKLLPIISVQTNSIDCS